MDESEPTAKGVKKKEICSEKGVSFIFSEFHSSKNVFIKCSQRLEDETQETERKVGETTVKPSQRCSLPFSQLPLSHDAIPWSPLQ
jgi:hypothetical protein